MGVQSVLKPIYDGYAVRHFARQGWGSWPVANRGWYCDVIAMRGTDIAIIEVKSPAEGSVDSNYDDTRGLSSGVRADLPTCYRQRRADICASIQRQPGVSVIKLYAVSVGCQLLRYLREYDERSRRYASVAGPSLGTSASHTLIPYIAVPVELKPQVDTALAVLQQRGDIASYTTVTDCRLCVSKVAYP